MTYKRLTDVLADCWDKPWADLSVEQRAAWFRANCLAFEYGRLAMNIALWHPVPDVDGVWDLNSPEVRRQVVEDYDAQYDPAMHEARCAGADLGYWSAVARDFGTVNWDYWVSLQSWTPREGACLLTELDPNEYDSAASNNNPQPVGLVRRIADIERRAFREQKANLLRDYPSPREWAIWADANGYALPGKLQAYCIPSPTADDGSWDMYTPDVRQFIAALHGAKCRHGPEDSKKDDVFWNYLTLFRENQREITEWELMNHQGDPNKAKTKKDELTKLRAEREALIIQAEVEFGVVLIDGSWVPKTTEAGTGATVSAASGTVDSEQRAASTGAKTESQTDEQGTSEPGDPDDVTPTGGGGEPYLRKGNNRRDKFKAWVVYQTTQLTIKPDDTYPDLAEQILVIAERWGFLSARWKEGSIDKKERQSRLNTIITMIPPNLTGGRGKSRSRPKK